MTEIQFQAITFVLLMLDTVAEVCGHFIRAEQNRAETTLLIPEGKFFNKTLSLVQVIYKQVCACLKCESRGISDKRTNFSVNACCHCLAERFM